MTPPVHHVLAVPGSLRRESYNKRLVRHLVGTVPERIRIEVADDLIRLPLYDEDVEAAGWPPEVAAARDRLAPVDAVLIATPEYNFGVPGPLKNFLDWMSRPPARGPLVGKPVALVGASTGRVGGTVQAQGQLRISLAAIGALVFPWPPILVAEAAGRFDGDVLTDEPTAKLIAFYLDRLVAFLDTTIPPKEPSRDRR